MKTVATILMVTAMGIAGAVAQPGPGDGAGYQGEGGKARKEALEKLDLTTEQREALKGLRQEMQKQMIDLRAAVQKARLEVESQLTATEVNREALMAAVEAEGAAEIAVKKAMAEHFLKVRDVVGAEKAAQLRESMQDRRGRGGPGSGPKDGEGRGPRGDQRGPPDGEDGGW